MARRIFPTTAVALLAEVFTLASLALALDGQIGIHDPSTIVLCNGKFNTYGTGGTSLVSDDGWTWRRGVTPPRRGMAPDVIHIGDRYYMYIAANIGAQPKAAINIIWSKTLDPDSADYKWEEGGVVASSDGVEDCNAIDPGAFLDPNDGRLWLVYAAHGQAVALTRPASSTKAPDPNGFLQRWLLLEPIRVQIRSNAELTDGFVQAAIKKEYFPNQFTVVPHDGDKVHVGDAELTWHAVDTNDYNVNLFHFAKDWGKPTFNVVFWAVTIVNCLQEMPNVRLAVGSNSASIWWVNGKEVIDIYGDRHMIVDDGVSKHLTLHKGTNIVRCAVINSPGLSNMCARFLDTEDRPLKGFTLSVVDTAK
jgi:hypothetical protein